MSALRVVRRASLTVGLLLVATSVFAQATATQKPFEPTVGQQGKDVVWVPTPQSLVDKMLDIAKLTPQDYLMDLGSGDGRTVITAAKRGARAKGIEYNPDMVALSQKNAAAAKVPLDRASFEKADLFETDFSQATVITMFLLPQINLKLRPKILDLKPGTRIVSNTFTMEAWEADQSETVSDGCTSWCTALLWIVPAKVAGTWAHAAGRAHAHAGVPEALRHARLDADRRRPDARRGDLVHRGRDEVHGQGQRHDDAGHAQYRRPVGGDQEVASSTRRPAAAGRSRRSRHSPSARSRPARVRSRARDPSRPSIVFEEDPLTEANVMAALVALTVDAARSGDVTTIEHALAEGVPIGTTSPRGDSLLMLASYHGQLSAVHLLLSQGADPEQVDARGQTPLAVAAFKGLINVAETLVAGGASVDAASADGRTPLMMAAAFNQTEMVEWLLDIGASPEARDANGLTALDVARAMGAAGAVDALVRDAHDTLA